MRLLGLHIARIADGERTQRVRDAVLARPWLVAWLIVVIEYSDLVVLNDDPVVRLDSLPWGRGMP
jgi:hypothetical protein